MTRRGKRIWKRTENGRRIVSEKAGVRKLTAENTLEESEVAE